MAHPCNQCEFEATSARQLSRHKAVTHVKNPLSCILCPFVTAYQTNLLRHRREVHGILGSKGNKSCKFCGFEAGDNDALILHQKQAHEDILKSARKRFAREKKTARGNVQGDSSNNSSVNGDYGDLSEPAPAKRSKAANLHLQQQQQQLNSSSLQTSTNLLAQYAKQLNSLQSIQSYQSLQSLLALSNGNGKRFSSGEQLSTANSNEDEEDDEDFWKEGFIDNPPSLVNFNYSDFRADHIAAELVAKVAAAASAQASAGQDDADDFEGDEDNEDNEVHQALKGVEKQQVELNPLEYKNYSPNSFDASDYGSSRPSTPFGASALNSSQNSDSMTSPAIGKDGLQPTRIRRQYNCSDCDFQTTNPREFLYHRRDGHSQKVKIVECPYCVYACQYFQKLQRHMLLVHKIQTSMTPPGEYSPESASPNSGDMHSLLNSAAKQLTNNRSLLRKAVMSNVGRQTFGDADIKNDDDDEAIDETDELMIDENGRDDEDDDTMQPDEMDPELMVDMSKNVFRCQDCNYVSNVEYLYLKHFRFHDADVRQCSNCDFSTQFTASFKYHLSAHGASATFTCEQCDFASDYEREINMHISNHHQSKNKSDDQIKDENNETDEAETVTKNAANKNDETNNEHHEQNDKELKQEENSDEHENDENVDCTKDQQQKMPNGNSKVATKHAEDGLMDDLVDEMDDQLLSNSSLSVVGKIERQSNGQSTISIRTHTSIPGGISYIRKTPFRSSAASGTFVSVKQCKHCPFKTDTHSKLEKHIACFHPEPNFRCPICETPFDSVLQMQSHLSQSHSDDQETGSWLSILDRMLYPRPAKNLNSSIDTSSQQLSPNHQQLGDHLSSLLQSALVAAQANHSASSNPNSSLSKDQKDKEALYSRCDTCGYRTRWRSELQRHMRVHTNVRPFACPHCDYRCKWKGDMNRHVLKFHRGAPHVPIVDETSSLPQLPSSIVPAPNSTSGNELFGNKRSSGSITSDTTASIPPPPPLKQRPKLIEEEDGIILDDAEAEQLEAELTARAAAENKVKIYKCTYCDFICPTASRYHVHYVQHLNTKPFMCSVCHHRSNWEWDVTKHIKMKSQRDSDHTNAKPVLVHESGRRNYSKYARFVHLVPANELPADTLSNGIGNTCIDNSRKMSDPDMDGQGEITDDAQAQQVAQQLAFQSMEDDPESIVITPDISLTIGEPNLSGNAGASSAQSTPAFRNASTPLSSVANNLSLNLSNLPPTIRPSKLFYCAYCRYTHRDSKSLVSHLSIHAGRKPFKCRRCGFSSNWREVLSRHVASRHNGNGGDIEQLFKYTVSKYICRIIDETGQINPGPEITTQDDVRQPGQPGFLEAVAQSQALHPPRNHHHQQQLLQQLQQIQQIQQQQQLDQSADSSSSRWSSPKDVLCT